MPCDLQNKQDPPFFKKTNQRAPGTLRTKTDEKPLINFVAFFLLVGLKKERERRRRRKGKCSEIYSFASASLLFISLLCSLSSGWAALGASVPFFLKARPDTTCLSLDFLGGLWLAELFFGLEL